jgi:acyl dehydratase
MRWTAAILKTQHRLRWKRLSSSAPSTSSTTQTIVTGTLTDGQAVVVGQFAEKAICYEPATVHHFAELVDDPNPLHTDTIIGDHPLKQGQLTTRPVVHGMLVASIFSSIFGNRKPGSVYLNQTLKFARPVHVGDRIIGRIQVTRVRQLQGKCIVACDTTVRSAYDDSIVYIRGNATVWVPQ